ncbi:unnamed protein product [Paramecium pentaurelia]|uniref:Protein kinase domain-containing protein n=1 Tax=Paramecium pentaurelia TaxID=43138 RepID=A0A8S1SH40_9CILI|nr:unnamed protein product [Paramecium pentaurelia]
MKNYFDATFGKGQCLIFKLKVYKILEVFPLGTQGIVYKVQERNKDNKFALKIVNQMSEKELEITKWLQKNHHKNIVNILDFSIQDQKVFILMECCEQNLYEKINNKLLDQKELRYFMISIARGLQFLHSHQIIHRDLKPENILIQTLTDKNNEQLTQIIYKIADFGLSLQQQQAQTKYIGTCYYMAPELINDINQPYDHKVDIWSLGTIVYELIKGKTLFEGFTIQQIYEKIKNSNMAENQKLLNEKLSIIEDECFFELVTNMLKYNPVERYDIYQVINKLSNKDENIIRNRSTSCNIIEASNQQQQHKITNFKRSFFIPDLIPNNFPIQQQLLNQNIPEIQNINGQNIQLNFNQNHNIKYSYYQQKWKK